MRTAGRSFGIVMGALTLVVGAAVACAGTASAAASAQYRIEGKGWGHGIGMSQYGANGYAKRGWTAAQIIQHYYTGTVLAPRPASGPTSLRVLLQSYLNPARIEMTSAGIVTQGVSSLPLVAGDIVHMRTTGAFLVVTRVREGAPNAIVTGASSADATIVPSVDGGARILFDADYARSGATFRGTLTGHIYDRKVSVINTVPIESYLRGVVPGEMPSSWSAEALKAQAIAARAYAVTGIQSSYNWFDVYSTTQSQVYGGIRSEAATTDAAIKATTGLVPRVGGASGAVARTYFFSTSGGRTAGNEEVWGSSPISYLRSVASPYERESSHFTWRGSEQRIYTPRVFGAKLGYSTTFRAAGNTIYRSGYAKDVNISTTGGLRTMTASRLQSKLGLSSTYFRINYLSIGAPSSVKAGSYVRIAGRIPRAGITTLLFTRAGVTKPIRLKPSTTGSWLVRARATSALSLTLTRAGVAGPRISVAVTS